MWYVWMKTQFGGRIYDGELGDLFSFETEQEADKFHARIRRNHPEVELETLDEDHARLVRCV